MDPQAAEIRQAIEETRAELGETAQALAYKTDVKARVGDKVNETKQRGLRSAHEALGKAAATGRPVMAKKRFALPLGAVMAGAGGVFLALRMRDRRGDEG